MVFAAFYMCAFDFLVVVSAFQFAHETQGRHRLSFNLGLPVSFRERIIAPSSPKKQDTGIMVQRVLIDKDEELNEAEFLADLDRSSHQMDGYTMVQSSVPWKFRGYDINCQVTRPGRTIASSSSLSVSKKPVILLVHGFGCSLVYWRETVKALSQAGFTVYSMDLLGHGKSAKPTENVTYSTNLWAQQLDDFCSDNLCEDNDIVLIGNSIGSIIALHAATGDFASESTISATSRPFIKEHIAGIGMFNCGIGMNIHSIVRHEKWNPLQRYVLDAIFTFLEFTLFGNVALMKWILDRVITREFLRSTLLQLYPNAENPEVIVDDVLVESLYEPAKDPNSAKVLSQILTNEAGMTPMEIHDKYRTFLDRLPIHVVWGDSDNVTPVDGIGEVGQFFRAQSADDDNCITMEVIKAGHIPFDEAPDVANGSMLHWLKQLPPR